LLRSYTKPSPCRIDGIYQPFFIPENPCEPGLDVSKWLNDTTGGFLGFISAESLLHHGLKHGPQISDLFTFKVATLNELLVAYVREVNTKYLHNHWNADFNAKALLNPADKDEVELTGRRCIAFRNYSFQIYFSTIRED